MKKIVIALLITISALFGGKINIAVASNVSNAMDEIKAEFKKNNPNTEVLVTLGSSAKLATQIINGAPYGIFMSADMKFPHALYDEKIAITEPIIYAQGEIAYLSVKAIDFSKGIELVLDASINKIAVANPATAPYGMATIEAMKNAQVYEAIKSKIVYAESISQVVSYAITAADVGFIAKASLFSEEMAKYKEGIHWVVVDSKLYTPIKQGIVLLKNSQNSSEYRAFYDFILSQKGKEIFKKYGYLE